MGTPDGLCRRDGELWAGGFRVRDDGWQDRGERAARWCAWSALGGHVERFFRVWQAVEGEFAQLWQGRAALAMERLALSDAISRGGAPLWRTVLSESPDQCFARELDRLAKDAAILGMGDPAYPTSLEDLAEPPVFLYVRGRREALAQVPTLAVVGSRDAPPHALEWTRRCTQALAAEGVVIVSGGAIGVDAAGHQGALDAPGTTIAVLPGGLDRLAPMRHASMFDAISRDGLLVTEYPMQVESRAYHFARRNRVIAALGGMTLVVQARLGGGTWLTARAAAELGRELLAVPADLGDPLGEGGNAILALGGRAVRDAHDVRRWMGALVGGAAALALPEGVSAQAARRGGAPRRSSGPVVAEALVAREASYMGEEARRVLAAMATGQGRPPGPWELDELVRAMELGAGRLTAILLALELDGWVEKVAGLSAWRLLAQMR